MLYVLLWYLVITIVGWLAFPIAYRLLPALRGRGYTLSRALGILVWGYIFWLLASLGILRNDTGSLLFGLAILIALSVLALRGLDLDELLGWLRGHKALVWITEILFLLAFAGWALVRAANPEALGTEKPMELAFINAILNSPEFPPHDPWLSGYAISYYHFGYILVAMLAKITATPGGIAFNLGSAMIFALSAIGAYGLVYNLLGARSRSEAGSASKTLRKHPFAALFGPLFLLIVSNLEGFLQVLHSRGLFWSRDESGALNSAFWRWLDIKDLNLPPQEPFAWIPTRFWWWWRASRVVQDYDLAGNPKEIIDEFPFFSYLLADLHPHVLVMPFALLVIALALNTFLDRSAAKIDQLAWRVRYRTLIWLATIALPVGITLLSIGPTQLSLSMVALAVLLLIGAGFTFVYLRKSLMEYGLEIFLRADTGELPVVVSLYITPLNFLLAALALGAMGFLNTWDFPFFVALFAAAYALSRILHEKKRIIQGLGDFLSLAILSGIAAIVLYLPFYLGFSSQAGGILPNLIYPTRGAHLWVMFAPFLVPLFAFLFYLVTRAKDRKPLINGVKLALGFTLLLWVFSLFLGFAITIIPEVGGFFQSTLAADNTAQLFTQALLRRFTSPGGWLTMVLMLSLTLAAILQLEPAPPKEVSPVDDSPPEPAPDKPEAATTTQSFVLLLVLWGTLLVLGPEFVFLRDLFGWRINTIFKFYYQAWLYWSIAAAYASIYLLVNLKRIWGTIFQVVLVLVLGMSLVYPTLSLWNKTNGFQPGEWTLDGTAYMQSSAPDELDAIHWLGSAPAGVVAEAVPEGGGSYTQYARVSTISGQPAVLGWIGHENQWRGGSEAHGSRQDDLETLYCTRDWEQAKGILDLYNIRYVFIGPLERSTYVPNSGTCALGLTENKFDRYLTPVFQQGPVIIYEYNGVQEP